MFPFLQLVFVLLVIILCAKAASYLSIKLRQPSVLGELLVGIERGIRAIAYSLFVPIFIVSISLGINLRDTNPEALVLLLVLVAIGVFGKMLGSGLGALLGGFSKQEALQLGAGMVSRGEVGLIVAAIGMQQGYVQNNELSAVIVSTNTLPGCQHFYSINQNEQDIS